MKTSELFDVLALLDYALLNDVGIGHASGTVGDAIADDRVGKDPDFSSLFTNPEDVRRYSLTPRKGTTLTLSFDQAYYIYPFGELNLENDNLCLDQWQSTRDFEDVDALQDEDSTSTWRKLGDHRSQSASTCR